MCSLFKFEPVVQEEMSFKEKVYGRRTKTDHKNDKISHTQSCVIKKVHDLLGQPLYT